MLVPLAALAAGCGGSAGGAKAADSPARDEEAPLTPLTGADSALAELNRAEGEIASLLGPPAAAAETSASATPVAPADAPAEPVVNQAQVTAQSGGDLSKQADRAPSPARDACSIACRALASMERAASHLCGLSGEADPSCTSARERVKNATDRVSARCPCSR